MKEEQSSIMYNALLICGAIFAVYNIVVGWVNMKERQRIKAQKDQDNDYIELIKENAQLKRKVERLEKMLL